MIASKFLYDEGMSDEVYNDEWAISGQVDIDYINKLEAEFLSAIQWEVFAKKREFCCKLLLLEARFVRCLLFCFELSHDAMHIHTFYCTTHQSTVFRYRNFGAGTSERRNIEDAKCNGPVVLSSSFRKYF